MKYNYTIFQENNININTIITFGSPHHSCFVACYAYWYGLDVEDSLYQIAWNHTFMQNLMEGDETPNVDKWYSYRGNINQTDPYCIYLYNHVPLEVFMEVYVRNGYIWDGVVGRLSPLLDGAINREYYVNHAQIAGGIYIIRTQILEDLGKRR